MGTLLIALDFDNTIVDANRPYDDYVTALEFRPGCLDALRSLKDAGHIHLLWSARTNRSLLYTPQWDPLFRAGIVRVSAKHREDALRVHWGRLRQMEEFVRDHLFGLIDATDDGLQGKPLCDLFLDDRQMAGPVDWNEVRIKYGAW